MNHRAVFPCMPAICLAFGMLFGSDLPDNLRQIVKEFRGEIYFAAKNLKTGELIEHRGEAKVQTASVIKLPILVEVFAQAKEHRLTLQDVMAYTEANRVAGSGILQDLDLGLQLTIRDLAVLMTVLSDNTATNMLIDRVAIDQVNSRMRRLGLSNTKLYRKVFRSAPEPIPEEEKKWGLGVTSPLDMLRLLEKIYQGEAVDVASCQEMVGILKKQRDRDQIPRFFTGKEWEKVEAAHKTGALERVRNDVGIVFTPEGDFILSLFAQESADTRWTPDNEATVALARLSEALGQHFRGLRGHRP